MNEKNERKMVTKEQRSRLDEIIRTYREKEHHVLRLSLQMITIDDVEGLVSGYTLQLKQDDRICGISCKSKKPLAGVSVDDLVKPYISPYPHQWWMKKTTRRKIAQRLIDEKVLERQYASFDELYDELLRLKLTTGDLFRYDLALRIGHCMGLSPKAYVYLHRGALEGARALHDKDLVTLPEKWEHRVKREVFDDVFPDLDAMDIENILCVCKKKFSKTWKL